MSPTFSPLPPPPGSRPTPGLHWARSLITGAWTCLLTSQRWGTEMGAPTSCALFLQFNISIRDIILTSYSVLQACVSIFKLVLHSFNYWMTKLVPPQCSSTSKQCMIILPCYYPGGFLKYICYTARNYLLGFLVRRLEMFLRRTFSLLAAQCLPYGSWITILTF